MTKQELYLIIELIDAKIALHNAADTSDGGLAESIRVNEIEKELYQLTKD